MKISWTQGLLLSSVVVLAVACQPAVKKSASHNSKPVIVKNPLPKYIECKKPRPEMCTQQYQPVCANRDTGMRCFKAPCPATKKASYGNACSACADKKVYGYTAGACKK